MSVEQAIAWAVLVSWVVIVRLVDVSSAMRTTLLAQDDVYEVLNGRFVVLSRSDEKGTQWTQQQKLERLEVLSNDLVFNTPWKSCIYEKTTGQNKYGDKGGQQVNSKFEDVRKVRLNFIHKLQIMSARDGVGTFL